MTNEIIKLPANSLTDLLADTDAHILHVLRTSVYPGAADESIAMVLSYCKAKKYDPLAKVVHIVPMKVKTGKKLKSAKGYEYDEKVQRDVIMPGIASYRIDAARSGISYGMSEPEYGEMITKKLGDKEVTFPEWCKITINKYIGGQIIPVVAKEYWIENYATSGNDSEAPNAMWFKRPRGQIAKCAEAQALRKAFPDSIGSLPTFEEMEGKIIEVDKYIEDEKKVVGKGIQAVKEAITKKVTKMANEIIEESEALNIDPETGEVSEESPSAAPTFEQVKAQMEAAKTPDDLIIATDVARAINKTKEQHDELTKLYKKKQLEVKG